MKIILQLLAINLFPLLALAMFTTWWSAIILVISIAIFIRFQVREHQNQYDDRLTQERMNQAMEWYLKVVKNQE